MCIRDSLDAAHGVFEGVFLSDLNHPIQDIGVQHHRYEAGADALNGVRAALAAA